MITRTSKDKYKSDGNTLEGYAILWNERSVDIYEGGRKFTEEIDRRAFEDSLSDTKDDVKLYFQHDSRMPLARTDGGSLKITPDERGLKFSAEIPNTTLGNDVKELIRRGVLTGEMSFGFYADKVRWANQEHRVVEKGRLLEISLVVDAAYPQTSSNLRSVSRDIDKHFIAYYRKRTQK